MPKRYRQALQTVTLCLVALCPALGQQQSEFLNPAADPAHKLTAGEFLKDIAYDFTGLIHKDSIAPLAIGTAAYGIATVPEQDLERHFARGDVWGAWGDPGGYIGNPFVLAGASASLFVSSRFTKDRRFRSLSYALVQGMIVDETISQTMKVSFQRLRPNGQDHASFPSSHSVDSFMFATVFAEHYGWKAAIPGYLIAAYVGATRMEDRKHHITDVVAGSTIGYLVGKTVSRKMHSEKPSWFTFNVYPCRGGFGGSVRIALSRRDAGGE